jgi:protein disulfide-isomerase A6
MIQKCKELIVLYLLQVKLGAVDATVHTIKSNQYGIQGYPTIKFFPPGKKDASSATDYHGGRTGSEIVNWALEKLAENVPAPEIKQVLTSCVTRKEFELLHSFYYTLASK